MKSQVIEKDIDTFKHRSSEERRTISSLNILSGLYTGGFRVIEVKMVQNPIDLDQAYFWSDRWQKDERAVDEEFKKGKFKKFSNPKDAIAYLRG